jgi:hypothetical protein
LRWFLALFLAILTRVLENKKEKEEKHLFFAILSLVLEGKECGKGTT